LSEAAAKTGLIQPDVFEASLVVNEDERDLGDTAAPRPATDPIHGSHLHAEPVWAGKTLSHFRLLRQLGQGTMGLVIQAEDLHLGRLVALKVLRKRIEGLDETRRVEQFLREARAAGRLDHPNVARVYEINQHRGWWYIATELLEGGTLHDVVRAAGPLTPARACPIIADAAAGLAAAHQAGMIHRDIKPSNLMLTRTGRCKVVDFGLVRVEDPNDPFDFTEQAVGTPHYMAPETIRRQPPTPLVDVYGLAAVLYFTLTGHPPYSGKDIAEVLRKHVKAPRPDVREACEACPESLAKLIQRGLAIEPKDRPNAATFALALRAESIGAEAAHDPLVLDASAGSSTLLEALAHTAAGRSAASLEAARTGSADRSTLSSATARQAWEWLPRIAAVALLAVLVGGGVWWAVARWSARSAPARVPPVASRAAFAAEFPEAPASYGLASAGFVPIPVDPLRMPPVATWVGRSDAQGAAFVAARDGRHYYPITDPRTALISVEQATLYPCEAAAHADGKTPGW
jgi:hypothetical protein